MNVLFQLLEYRIMPFFAASFVHDKLTNFHDTVDPKQDLTPILLLHGKSSNRAEWSMVKHWLQQQNHNAVFTYNYVLAEDGSAHHFSTPLDTTLDDLAKMVAERIKAICSQCNSKKIIVVGHSMGGIVGSIAAEKYTGDRVLKVVTLGSPFQGSYLASGLDEKTNGIFTSWFNKARTLKEMMRAEGHQHTMEELCKLLERQDQREYMFVGGTFDLMVDPTLALPPKLTSSMTSKQMTSGHFGYVFPGARKYWVDHIIPFLMEKKQQL